MEKPIIKIFKAGTHTASNGSTVTYTESDLIKIAENYNNQANDIKHEAPIIGGDHNKAGKKALGFVEKLIIKGSELFASILPTPELINDVRNNRYKHVSIGLNSNGNFDHLAVLGAVNPAVKGLGLLQFSEGELSNISEYNLDNNNLINQEELMNPQLQAFREELQKFISETYGADIVTAIIAKFDELLKSKGLDAPQAQPPQAQQQGFNTYNPMQQRVVQQYGQQFSESEEGKKMILDYAQMQHQINELQFSAYADKELTKITPALKPIVIELMHQLTEKETNFSENGTKLNGIDLMKKLVSSLPNAIETKEIATNDLAFSQTDSLDIAKIVKERQNA